MSEQFSASSPVFLTNAEDILARTERQGSRRALAMAAEARELVDTFRGWQAARPDDDVRVVAIERLFDLHRRAMEYLANHPPPSSGHPPVRSPSGVIVAASRQGAEDDEDDDVPSSLEGPARLRAR